VQYEVLSGGITRDTLWRSLQIMPSTPSSLPVKMVLCNNLTIMEVAKLTPSEVGESLSEGIMRDGWMSQKFMGVEWLVTIKKGLVATNNMYHFTDPKFTGKNYMLEDTTMYIRRDAFFIEFMAYQLGGGAIANTSSVTRAKFE
jgi:hypothetical protein